MFHYNKNSTFFKSSAFSILFNFLGLSPSHSSATITFIVSPSIYSTFFLPPVSNSSPPSFSTPCCCVDPPSRFNLTSTIVQNSNCVAPNSRPYKQTTGKKYIIFYIFPFSVCFSGRRFYWSLNQFFFRGNPQKKAAACPNF
jgi:hypothetical protein